MGFIGCSVLRFLSCRCKKRGGGEGVTVRFERQLTQAHERGRRLRLTIVLVVIVTTHSRLLRLLVFAMP